MRLPGFKMSQYSVIECNFYDIFVKYIVRQLNHREMLTKWCWHITCTRTVNREICNLLLWIDFFFFNTQIVFHGF